MLMHFLLPVVCCLLSVACAAAAPPAAMAPGGRVCFTPPLSVNYQYDIAPGIHMQVRYISFFINVL